MVRALIVLVAASLLLGSCTQKMVCPAYQSAYIYDKDELRKKFSYFNEDSTPKVLTASKTKFLVAEPTTYKKKYRSIKTVEARPIKTKVPDSLTMDAEISGAELDKAAQSIIDSTYIVPVEPADSLQTVEDSVYVISVDREVRVLKYNFPDSLKYDTVTGKYVPETPHYYVDEVGFNTEQNNYMWYLRDVLVLPDVRLAKQGTESAKGTAAKGKKQKKGIKAFFAGLFKKKKKEPVDSASIQPVSEEAQYNVDFNELDNPRPDSVAAEEVAPQPQQPAKQKKGLFSKKSKKEKPAKKETQPAKKDEGDGF